MAFINAEMPFTEEKRAQRPDYGNWQGIPSTSITA